MCLRIINDVAATETVIPDIRSIALSRYGGARSVACEVRHTIRTPPIRLFTCVDANQHERDIAPSAAAPAAPFDTVHRTRHLVPADVWTAARSQLCRPTTAE